MSDDKTPGFIVYAGPRPTVDGSKWIHVYYRYNTTSRNNGQPFTEDEKDADIWKFETPLHKNSPIGAVFTAMFTADGSALTRDKKAYPCGVWKCQSDKVEWNAQKVVFDEREAVMEEAKVNSLIKQLEPIKIAYRDAGWKRRRVILAEVLRIITGG